MSFWTLFLRTSFHSLLHSDTVVSCAVVTVSSEVNMLRQSEKEVSVLSLGESGLWVPFNYIAFWHLLCSPSCSCRGVDGPRVVGHKVWAQPTPK